MRFGMTIDEALKQAMLDLRQLDDPCRSEMNIIALDCNGAPAAASSTSGKTFIYKTTEMTEFVEDERQVVPYEDEV